MGYGSPLIASARYETLGAGTGTGTTVTAAGSANTKGLYSTVGTASFQYDGIYLYFSTFSANARFRVDIAINTTADTIIIPDLFIDSSTAATTANTYTFIPVSIPAGAAVKARCQSTTASASFSMIVGGFETDSNGTRGFARAISCTDWTNTDPTGAITLNGITQTGWGQIQASTTARLAALYAMFDARGAALTSADLLLDIGWGAAASERVLTQILIRGTGSHQQILGPFPCDFPAGTRLAFRGQASTTDTNTVGLSLLGIAL